MSVNIDHPNEDISTSAGLPPSLGSQSPLVANDATVTANSSGNIARWVMTTAEGSGSDSNYWAKIATINLGATGYQGFSSEFLIQDGWIAGATGFAKIRVGLYQSATLDAANSSIEVLEASGVFRYDDFMAVASSTTNGTNIELWMQKATSYGKFTIYELGKGDRSGLSAISYYNDAAWVVATPSGTFSITSDWAGSGQLTSTSFLNGWAGTAYYEKSADGRSYLYIDASTIGTTTDNTKIFTIPAGYRPSNNLTVTMTGNDATFGGAAGRAIIDSSGDVYIYGYTGTNTLIRFQFDYVARN